MQVNPKKNLISESPKPEKQDLKESKPEIAPKPKVEPKPDILTEAELNEKRYATENARLEEEIRAAQAVLAQLKPNTKPKGLKTDKQKR